LAGDPTEPAVRRRIFRLDGQQRVQYTLHNRKFLLLISAYAARRTQSLAQKTWITVKIGFHSWLPVFE
jgi:hypothetical protein